MSTVKQWLQRSKSTAPPQVPSQPPQLFIPVIRDCDGTIPPLHLVPWRETVLAAYTGPNAGLTSLDMNQEGSPSCSLPLAGATDWNKPSERAYGISLSLYEEEIIEQSPALAKKEAPSLAAKEKDPPTLQEEIKERAVVVTAQEREREHPPSLKDDNESHHDGGDIDPFPAPPPLSRNKSTINKPSLSVPAPSLPPSSSPRVKRVAGEPVADVFAVLARENNTIMAIADGVNWGKKPRLAARCAVQTAIAYISDNINKINATPHSRTLTTLLLEAMENAHQCILEHSGTLTTLSIGIVCQLKPNKKTLLTTSTPNSSSTLSRSSSNWGLFIASVGDSPIFVYSPTNKSITEATVACHPKDGIRTAAFSGGALGPAIGTQADMENLSLNYLPVAEGDIVFMTTDGISDNFYPQVIRPGEYRDAKKGPTTDVESSTGFLMVSPSTSLPSSTGLPSSKVSTPSSRLEMRCCENIPELADHLRRHESILNGHISAQTVAASLVNFAVEITDEKRRFFTECKEKGVMVKSKSREDPEFDKLVKRLPGKLDHATVVACTVGKHK
ncbi:PREDICTED: uncharacterized protein LOC100632842 [Amphimedon queenslandica]|uniref:PPM-type phosphatase domain-containing protein n=1 Tax=Amphimedon queenslandica TaxID=400682 RepID=A0A1X7U4G4_AMPQE|nr:PREDICTED: uncharacterized protein LOC100632842 [Amphimedon queenslandica]|eukprot:XP_003388989.1 PREDICTED: uncharacterized protein LOC100632842 [Amphimedon queenslandica]